MNDLTHERGILRRQIKDDVIQHFRRERAGPSALKTFARVATCHVLGGLHTEPAARVAAERYANDPDVLKGLAAPSAIFKAATSPAMTGVTGWAAELATPGNLSALQAIAPSSCYAQLSQHPAAIRANLAGRASVKVPTRTPPVTVASPFVGEGEPIPVRALNLSSASLPPRKASFLSNFSEEMLTRGSPSVELVVRAVLSYDVALGVDSVLLGAGAGDLVDPPGLLNGVVATAASPDSGLAGFAADVRALAAAIEASGPLIAPTLLMSSTSALLISVLSQGGAADMPIIAASTVPAKRLIMVDAANFASAEGDEPNISTSKETLIHELDDPLPISTLGAPATVAAPTRSMWQTQAVSLRLLQGVSWVLTRAGRVAFVDAVNW